MPHESHISPPDDRDARMRRAVADFVREVVLGRDVRPDTWAEAYPDLLPELKVELKKAQLIGLAYQKALADGSSTAVDPDEQPTVSYWRTDVSTLHVRCPHCHNPVDISGDDSLVDILCTTCGSSFSLLCDTLATPTLKRIGHFELVERLGIGGFGTVWKARDTELDRTVAIKIPRAGRLGTPDIEVSFFREARAAAQLKHPGIVTVHEVGRQDDTIYIVSDLVRGASLSEWLTAAQPTAREAAEICAKIADALHHAHEAGVVHRDLKPSNIMVDKDDQPHIMDFGLARRDAGEITVTIDGQMLGTPAYMSPEHARGEAHQADRCSDVYSLGVILFQLLTGELPFRGHARMLMLQILRDEPPKPRSLRAGVPRDLQTICLKCLEKQPSKRYATAAELADELRRYLRGEPILAQPITQAGRLYRWCKREPAIAALSAALLIALTAGILGVSWYAVTERRTNLSNLYHRMVQQAQLDRMQAREGYIKKVWQSLEVARATNTPELDLDVLRQEAVASFGDVRGYDPVTIESPDNSITVTAVHPRGDLLAIGHQDGSVQLHDPTSPDSVGEIAAKGKSIAALSFTDDGQRLLSVDAHGQVRETTIERAATGVRVISTTDIFHADDGHEWFDFAGSGKYLATSNEQSACVWDLEKRIRIKQVPAPEGRKLRCVRVSPDGKWLAASADTTPDGSTSDLLLLWKVAGEEAAKEIQTNRGQGYQRSLAFSHDSQLIAFGGEGVAVYSVPSLERYFSAAGDAVLAVAFSPDDQLLSLVQIRGTVAIWFMTTSTKIATLIHARARNATEVESAMFSPHGRYFVSARRDSARIWDFRAGGERIELSGNSPGTPTLMFLPDGQLLATGGKDAAVRIWDYAAGKQDRPPLLFNGPVQCLSIHKDGKWLATADWSAGKNAQTLHVASMENWSTKATILHKLGSKGSNSVNAVAFSPNGEYLAACGCGVQLWRIRDGDPIGVTPSEVAYQSSPKSRFLRFSPDSNWLVWDDDQTVRILDVKTGKPTSFEAKVHSGWHGFAFLNDDLAFVGRDLKVELWDVERGERNDFLGEPGEFQSPHIAASPKGPYLVGLNQSDSIALWDVAARKKLFVFRSERSPIWSLAFDSTGTKLAVGLSDGGIIVWDLKVINDKLGELGLEWMRQQE